MKPIKYEGESTASFTARLFAWYHERQTAREREIEKQEKQERDARLRNLLDPPSKLVNPKGWLISPQEDDEFAKKYLPTPQRAKLSPSAKVFGFFAVMAFIALFGLLLQFIASLSS